MFEKFLRRRNVQGPKNGKWKEFNKHAVLVAEGNYQQDLKDGVWRQYYETGELLIEETYELGILHGRYAAYHMNGKLLSEGDYQHGKREGFFEVFDEEGRPAKRLLFVNNTLLEETEVPKVHVRSAKMKVSA